MQMSDQGRCRLLHDHDVARRIKELWHRGTVRHVDPSHLEKLGFNDGACQIEGSHDDTQLLTLALPVPQ